MLKKIIKYWYLEMEFLLFFLMFINTPPVCDRWLEELAYEFGDVLRYLWSDVYWASHVNTRFLSNFFSFIMDNSILLHAASSAIMLTSISIICMLVCRQSNIHDKTRIAIFSCFCLTLVSKGIYKEVYLYASTLYLSSYLIVCAILLLELKLAEGKIAKKETYFLYVMIFIGCSWLESNIFPILAVTGGVWFLNSLEHKCIDKKTIFPFILSIVCSFFMIAITFCVHKTGKLSRSGGKIHFTVEPFVDLIKDNCFLFVILSVLMIINVKKIKGNHLKLNSQNKIFENRLFHLFQIIIWAIILIGNLVLCGKYIYEILCTEPDNALKTVYGWFSVQNNFIESFFDLFLEMFYLICPVFIVFAVISIIYVIYVNQKLLAGVSILLMGCAETIIVVLGLYPGDRITSGFIFSLILLIGLLIQNIQPQKDIGYINHLRICFWCVGLIAFFNVYSIFMFLHEQNEVAAKRQFIAEEVKRQQILGMWDYNSFAIMPVYCASGSGMELVGETRKNPINADAYYPFLLRYYDLDPDTKILFSNNSALQIVKIIQNDNTTYLYANSLREYEDVLYKFQIMEESSSGDADLFLISESDWQSESTWIIPDSCLNYQNLRYRCSIKKNDVIINEAEGDAISWQENGP